jgi:hypothetical protein
MRRSTCELQADIECLERAIVVGEFQGVDDADVAPRADLAVAMRGAREQLLRGSI